MSNTRRNKFMWRLSIFTAGLIALSWTVYSQFEPVPMGLGLSRWWDVLIGPIWSVLLIWLLTNMWIEKVEVYLVLIPCPLFGLTGLPSAAILEEILGRPFGSLLLIATVAFLFGILIGLARSFSVRVILAGGLAFVLPATLLSGLLTGLSLAITFFLCFGLPFLLMGPLTEMCKTVWLFAVRFPKWLIAEGED